MLPSLLFILTFLFYFHGAFCKHLWPSPRVPSPPSRYSQLCCQLFILFYFSFSSLNTHTHVHVRNERKDIFLHIFLTFKNNLPAAFPPCHLFEPPQHFVGLFCCAVAANLKRNSNVYLTVCVCGCYLHIRIPIQTQTQTQNTDKNNQDFGCKA